MYLEGDRKTEANAMIDAVLGDPTGQQAAEVERWLTVMRAAHELLRLAFIFTSSRQLGLHVSAKDVEAAWDVMGRLAPQMSCGAVILGELEADDAPAVATEGGRSSADEEDELYDPAEDTCTSSSDDVDEGRDDGLVPMDECGACDSDGKDGYFFGSDWYDSDGDMGDATGQAYTNDEGGETPKDTDMVAAVGSLTEGRDPVLLVPKAAVAEEEEDEKPVAGLEERPANGGHGCETVSTDTCLCVLCCGL